MNRLRMRARLRNERGAVALISAVLAVVLLGISAFVVDFGATWTRRGQLQIQADKAALYAADSLPAFDDSTRLRVAKAVAYYFACHPVPGQSATTAGIPGCPAGTNEDSTPIVTFAQTLLGNGWVSFPTRTQVKVITPPDDVKFVFGPAVGATNTVQQKTATAGVYSPGDILPMGLSLSCLTSFLGSAPNGVGNAASGVLPFNYVSAGTNTGATGGTNESSIVWPTFDGGTSSSVTVSNVTAGGLGVIVSGTGWGSITDSPTVQVIFRKSGHSPAPVTAVVTTSGQTTLALPTEVTNNPGDWKVRVAVLQGAVLGVGGSWVMSDASFVYTVPTQKAKLSDILNIDDFVACGRLADSPRSDSQQINWLSENIRHGLDHEVVQNPLLTTAVQNLNLANYQTDTPNEVGSLINNPSVLFSCDPNNPVNVLDIPSEISKGLYPNCMRINTSSNRVSQLTTGFLTSGGRFDCATHTCFDQPVTFPGYSGEYNNDHFDSFVIPGRQSLLTDQMFFALSTYLTPGIPLITPQSAISDNIYASPRFFWVAVVSTAYTSQGGEDYPILTFRPIFITQGRPDSTPSLETVDALTQDMVNKIQAQASNLVTSIVTGLGVTSLSDLVTQPNGLDNLIAWLGNDSPTYEKDGLVFEKKDGLLHAVRFMTIEPGALPVVPNSYQGSVTDYLGVGPKIVRLIR